MPELSTKALCEKVCQGIADGESKRLRNLYAMSPQKLREREQIELTQCAIALPLLAQEQVKAAFAESGILYAQTAWKELSEQLPSISYEYIDWKIPPQAPPSLSHGSRNAQKSSTTGSKGFIEQAREWARKRKENVSDNREARSQKLSKAQRQEELKRRIAETRGRNLKRAEDWCGTLQLLMGRIMEKYLPDGAP